MLGTTAYNQQATYWAPGEQSGFGGYTYGSPSLILVRWEERTDKFLNSVGEEKIAKAIIYSPDECLVGGYLAKGDQTATSDPTAITSAFEIQRADTIPDLRGLNQEHRNFL